MAAQEQTLTDADFSAPETSSPTALSDSDFQQPVEAKLSQPSVPQANTYVEDKDVVVGHPADLSHDQVNDAIQAQIYGRPQFDWHSDALPASAEALDIIHKAIVGAGAPFDPNTGYQMIKEGVVKPAILGTEDVAKGVAGLMKWVGEGLHGTDQEISQGDGIPGETAFVRSIGDKLAAYGKNIVDFVHGRQTTGAEDQDPALFRGTFSSNPSMIRVAAGVTRGVPLLGASALATLATGTIGAPAAFGLISGGQAYEQSREIGSDPDQAQKTGIFSGIGNALFAALGMDRFLKGFGDGTVVRGAVEGAALNQVMNPFNNMVAKIGGDKARKWFDNQLETTISLAATAGIASSFHPGGGEELDTQNQEMHNAGVSARDIDSMRSTIGQELSSNPGIVEKVIQEQAAQAEAQRPAPENPAPEVGQAASPLAEQLGPEYETKIEEGSDPFDAVKNILNSHSIDLPEDQARALMDEMEIQRQRPTSAGVEGVQMPASTVRKEASGLRGDDIEANQVSEVERFVLDNGGIRRYKDGLGKEEYDALPERFKNPRKGRGLDEMADNLVAEGLLPEGSSGDELNNVLRDIGELPKPATVDSYKVEAEAIARAKREGYERVQPGIKGDIRENTGQVDQSRTVSEATALRESFRAQARAARESALSTKAGVADAQTKLIDFIEGSDLSLNDKAKFTRTVKNVQTAEQLKNALPYVEQRINRLVEDASQRDLRAKIDRELESTKVRKQSGKPVGKYTPEIQNLLDQARQAASLTKEEAADRINQNLERYQDSFPPPDVVAQNEMLSNVGGLEGKNSAQLSQILESIKATKETGKSERALQVEARKSYIDDSVNKVIGEIAGAKGLSREAISTGIVNADKVGTVRDLIESGLRDGLYAWPDFMDILAGKSGKRFGDSFIEHFGDVDRQTYGERRGIREGSEAIRDLVTKSYGVEKDGDVLDILRENKKVHNLGTFKNFNGVEVNLVHDKDQFIKKYMELQDTTLDKTFFHEDAMAWTPEMVEAVDKLLTNEDKKFGDAQLAFYKDYLPSINKVYRSIYGVDLQGPGNYSPIGREGVGNSRADNFGEFMEDQNFRRSTAPGATKSRVENSNTLRFDGSVDVLQRHIAEMEHFKNWAEKVRDLTSVFGDKGVKQAITENYGRGLYRSIAENVDNFARGGIESSKRMAALDAIRAGLTRSSVSLRPVMALKRFTAVLAYMARNNALDFTSGVADFMLHPLESLKVLNQIEAIGGRGYNFDREIKDTVASEQYSAFRKQPGFLNILMLFMRAGDKMAIGMGAWGIYKRVLRETGSEDKALEAASKATSEIEASGNLADQSKLQSSGSIARLFTMFTSQPMKFARLEIQAVRNGINGRMTPAEAAKQFAIFHFVLPMTFQYVSDMFHVDVKKQKRAVIWGSLNGLFIVKDFATAVLNHALGIKGGTDNDPFSQQKQDLVKALSILNLHHIRTQDVMKSADGALALAGTLKGIPLEQAKNMFLGLEDIYHGNYKQGIGGLMGWPASVLKEDSHSVKL